MANDNDITIMMSMRTDIPAQMKTITSTTQGCSKAFEEFKRRTAELTSQHDALNKRYDLFVQKSAAAKTGAEKLKLEMSAMAKAARASGEELDTASYEKLQSEYQKLTDKAKTFKSAAADTQKAMKLVAEEARKMNFTEAEADGEGTGRGGLTEKFGGDIWMFLSRSGTGKMLGEALSNVAGTFVGSALGDAGSSLVSNLLSGAASGAAGGAMFGPWGAAIGGFLGGTSGFINAKTQEFQTKDNAFKDYYRSLYENANAGTAERLASGSILASGRETTKLSFNTLLGDDKKAGAFLGQIQDTANTTPFLYDDLVGISKTMLSFGTAAEDIIPTLTKVGDAGAALGLSTGDIGTVATYLGRMQSSGKATMEDLNPLNERGFSVFQWLADDQGASVGDVYSQISKGELSGSYVSEVILSQFEKLYGGMMDIQSKSTAGLDSTLQGLKENVDAAGGERYNEARKASKEADIAAYGGALGDKLAELSAIGGEVQAYGENLKDQFQREALEAVLTGTLDKASTVFSQEDAGKLEELSRQFSEANQAYENGSLEAGQKMLDLKEEAEALAAAAYESSEWYQALQEAETEEIAAIRELTAGMDACTNALRISNEFSKGGASAWFGWWKGGGEEGTKAETGTAASYLTGAKKEEKPYRYNAYLGYAYGLEYVPFDNYPALLHQGERVLTAAEARGMDRGVLPGVPAMGDPAWGPWETAAGRFPSGGALADRALGGSPAPQEEALRPLAGNPVPLEEALWGPRKIGDFVGRGERNEAGGVPASGGDGADGISLWGPRKIGDFVGRGERNGAGGGLAGGGDGADGISLWGPRKIGDFVGRGERNGAGGGLAGGGDGAERNFVGRRGSDTHLMVHVEAINVRGSAEPDFVDEIAEALLEKIRLAGLRGGG